MLMGDTRGSRGEQYSKASRSDYFSRNSRSNKRTKDNSSEAKDRLSHGNQFLPSWEAVGYTQEVKSTAPQGDTTNSSDTYAVDDLELGAVEPSAHLKNVEGGAPSSKRTPGEARYTHDIGRAQDMRIPDQTMGIVKTMEVNVRR